MNILRGNQIFLRALEPTDLDFLYLLENDEDIWEVSNTVSPYSKFVLKQYLDNAHRDIFEVKQMRLAVCTNENEELVGLVDLFDFEPKHRRVGVGIIIYGDQSRRKGFAFEAIEILIKYSKLHLNAHQLFANIGAANDTSIKLFEKLGFERCGLKKDWILHAGQFKDELIYQYIHE